MKNYRLWPGLVTPFLALAMLAMVTACHPASSDTVRVSPVPLLIPSRSDPSPAALRSDRAVLATATVSPPVLTATSPPPTQRPPTRPPTQPPPPTATATASPTATATPAGPVITLFTAAPPTVAPGGSVTLTWQIGGGSEVIIQEWLPGDLPGQFIQVAISGTLTTTISTHERLWHTFTLLARDSLGNTAESSLTVTLSCPYTYFFPFTPPGLWDQCPAGPAAVVAAAEQPFEGGWMLWLAQWPEASGTVILVFYNDGTYEWYNDTWTVGEPVDDPTVIPPPGLYQPVRGFGKVWRTNAEVRERLGWATALEVAFTSTTQQRWMPYYLTNGVFLSIADGRIAQVDRNPVWGFVSGD
ncbi:MAG: hypothetical protein L0332_22770 [Chloroflexi bacterium]|nr:hypothetical protein [Chloroflexota bacterium]MCI0580404.1 hypothetical protein [Chloroflexota bacterium]MCI0650175.1 hypothetical protein [Chloroflexota bacterium]MCI0729514.1 hypothetical protein [Chloroflexota bacterium]